MRSIDVVKVRLTAIIALAESTPVDRDHRESGQRHLKAVIVVVRHDLRRQLRTGAIAHHGFEAVHPYVDGNGRVGRLLLNLILMQEGYPPALLLNDWRTRYIQGLNAANAGNYGTLINLAGQAVEAGLDLYLEACAAAPEYHLLRELVEASGYPLEYLSWLARQGRIEAVKRGGRWYSRLEAIEKYKAEAEEGKKKRGRPASRHKQ